MATASCIIFSKTLSRRAITSMSCPAGEVSLAQFWAMKMGKSNSMHVFHWSAFNLPCPGLPRFDGGPWQYGGRMTLAISVCSAFNSSFVTLSTNTSPPPVSFGVSLKYASPINSDAGWLTCSRGLSSDEDGGKSSGRACSLIGQRFGVNTGHQNLR